LVQQEPQRAQLGFQPELVLALLPLDGNAHMQQPQEHQPP
jgi:hypothetical protein